MMIFLQLQKGGDTPLLGMWLENFQVGKLFLIVAENGVLLVILLSMKVDGLYSNSRMKWV